MTDSGYVLVVKPSARKVSATAGEWVNRHGPRRRFDSKPLACAWARACRTPSNPVWVQDAPPWAGDDADGYLVGRTGRGARVTHAARQASLDTTEW